MGHGVSLALGGPDCAGRKAFHAELVRAPPSMMLVDRAQLDPAESENMSCGRRIQTLTGGRRSRDLEIPCIFWQRIWCRRIILGLAL